MPTMRKGSIRLSGFALYYTRPVGLYLEKRKGFIVHELLFEDYKGRSREIWNMVGSRASDAKFGE